MRPDKIRGNVFVANLPLGLTDEQLAEVFDPYGMVLRAHLARDPATGETRGYGLVQLAPDRVVDDAIAGVSASGVGGRRVDVRRADPDMSITPVTRARPPAWTPRPAASRPAHVVETVQVVRPTRTVRSIPTAQLVQTDAPARGRLTLRLPGSDRGAVLGR